MENQRSIETLEEDLKKWLEYRQNVLKEGNLEEVVEDEDLLALAEQERNADPDKDLELLTNIFPEVEKFVNDLILETPPASKGKPVKEYAKTFQHFQLRKNNFINQNCQGRKVLFDIAWNYLIQTGSEEFEEKLLTFYTNSFGLDDKKIGTSLTIKKADFKLKDGENSIMIHLPNNNGDKSKDKDEKLLLLPRGAKLQVLFRHGISANPSDVNRVGDKCTKKQFLTKKGEQDGKKTATEAIRRLLFLKEYIEKHDKKLDPQGIDITTSNVPNTKQIASYISEALEKIFGIAKDDQPQPVEDPGNFSQNFGLLTNLNKEVEKKLLAEATGLSEENLKKFNSGLFRTFLGGQSKIEYYIEDVLALRQKLEDPTAPTLNLACTHSSRLNNLLIFSNDQSFREAYENFSGIREDTNAPVIITYDPHTNSYTPYEALVGKSNFEKFYEINSRIEITRQDIQRVVVLGSGGICSGMNAALTGLLTNFRMADNVETIVVPYAFRGLYNGQEFTGSLKNIENIPGFIPGCGRFDELKRDPKILDHIVHNILEHYDADAVIALGGEGTMRALRELAKKLIDQKVVVSGMQTTMDRDGQGETIGFQSTIFALRNFYEHYRQDSIGMSYPFAIEVLGRNSGHVAVGFAAAVSTGELENDPVGLCVPEFGIDKQQLKCSAELIAWELYKKQYFKKVESVNSMIVIYSEDARISTYPQKLWKKVLENLKEMNVDIGDLKMKEGRPQILQRTPDPSKNDVMLASNLSRELVNIILSNPEGARGKGIVTHSPTGESHSMQWLGKIADNRNPLDLKSYNLWHNRFLTRYKLMLKEMKQAGLTITA